LILGAIEWNAQKLRSGSWIGRGFADTTRKKSISGGIEEEIIRKAGWWNRLGQEEKILIGA
jgi:hypothetical protein